MDELREKSIRLIIDTAIKSFADGFELRHNQKLMILMVQLTLKRIIASSQFWVMNSYSIVHLYVHLILPLGIY